MPGIGRPRKAVRGTLDTVASIFTERLRHRKPPPTPPEAVEALAESDLWCEKCRAKFGNRESYLLHKKTYHQPIAKISHKYTHIEGPDDE